MKARQALITLFLSLAGCTIRQEVKPVALSGSEPRQICLIEDTSVLKDILGVYETALSQKGFTVRTLPQGTSVDACPLTSTYTANWRWDVALYLTYADLKVFRDGRLAGEALYDSTGGSANLSKFVHASKKIQELTDQLFPG